MRVEILVGDQKATFEARDETDLLRQVKAEAKRRAPFLLRAALGAMSDLAFAAQVVAHANRDMERADPPPKTAREFFDWATSRGYLEILPP